MFKMWWLVIALVVEVNCGTCPFKPSAEDQQTTAVLCEKTPRTESQKTPADGRFELRVDGLIEDRYLPEHVYDVTLRSRAPVSYFETFLIMVDGEYVVHPENPRIYTICEPGTLISTTNATQYHPRCPTFLQHTNNSPKSIVQMKWKAPLKSQGCVKIHAMVAESADVWYMDDPPLSVKVCEDDRKLVDIKPEPISTCGACEEAKYELVFEGLWSANTHPYKFPVEASRRYSDLVGASHSKNFELWGFKQMASPGLKLLAEAGNTTTMEHEIQNGAEVRTVIKASGRANKHMSEPTSAIFRVDKEHHLISIATSIVPSPDWFLGVTQFELCSENNTWVTDRVLNLYLNDAGTDNGVSYESSNEQTLPPMPVTAIREVSDNANSPFYSKSPGTVRPYAKMRVRLLRLYRETCQSTYTERNTNSVGVTADGNGNQPSGDGETENPVEITTERSESSTPQNIECSVSKWDDWSECYPPCSNGMVTHNTDRYRYRERFLLSDGGLPYRFNKDISPELTPAPPSEECEKMYEGHLIDYEECPSCP